VFGDELADAVLGVAVGGDADNDEALARRSR
jgi:hypothetical protein